MRLGDSGCGCLFVPFMFCRTDADATPVLSLSPVSSATRFSAGTERTGGGALDADVFGVVCSACSGSSSMPCDSGTEGPASSLFTWGSSEVEGRRVSDLGSGGGGEGWMGVQLRTGYRYRRKPVVAIRVPTPTQPMPDCTDGLCIKEGCVLGDADDSCRFPGRD